MVPIGHSGGGYHHPMHGAPHQVPAAIPNAAQNPNKAPNPPKTEIVSSTIYHYSNECRLIVFLHTVTCVAYSIFAEAKLHIEIHSRRSYESRVSGQVQSER